jgi:hypothetical protein
LSESEIPYIFTMSKRRIKIEQVRLSLLELKDSPSNALYELGVLLGESKLVERVLYRLRELIDVPLTNSQRASTDTVHRAATAVAISQSGMLDEANHRELSGSLGIKQGCFTLEQWHEIREEASEAIAWLEDDAERQRV